MEAKDFRQRLADSGEFAFESAEADQGGVGEAGLVQGRGSGVEAVFEGGFGNEGLKAISRHENSVGAGHVDQQEEAAIFTGLFNGAEERRPIEEPEGVDGQGRGGWGGDEDDAGADLWKTLLQGADRGTDGALFARRQDSGQIRQGRCHDGWDAEGLIGHLDGETALPAGGVGFERGR